MTIAQASAELRRRSGMSQQAFATELGLAIRTVARYESGAGRRGPRMLVRLYLAAVEHRQPQLGEIFRRALCEELGVDTIIFGDREGRRSR